ncbi:MAG: hypothetical protein K2M30_00765, partial [Desulfovibrionaceae bacterium]|nr:hypothetical protein [Desulfovibrionaceae bacterium]
MLYKEKWLYGDAETSADQIIEFCLNLVGPNNDDDGDDCIEFEIPSCPSVPPQSGGASGSGGGARPSRSVSIQLNSITQIEEKVDNVIKDVNILLAESVRVRKADLINLCTNIKIMSQELVPSLGHIAVSSLCSCLEQISECKACGEDVCRVAHEALCSLQRCQCNSDSSSISSTGATVGDLDIAVIADVIDVRKSSGKHVRFLVDKSMQHEYATVEHEAVSFQASQAFIADSKIEDQEVIQRKVTQKGQGAITVPQVPNLVQEEYADITDKASSQQNGLWSKVELLIQEREITNYELIYNVCKEINAQKMLYFNMSSSVRTQVTMVLQKACKSLTSGSNEQKLVEQAITVLQNTQTEDKCEASEDPRSGIVMECDKVNLQEVVEKVVNMFSNPDRISPSNLNNILELLVAMSEDLVASVDNTTLGQLSNKLTCICENPSCSSSIVSVATRLRTNIEQQLGENFLQTFRAYLFDVSKFITSDDPNDEQSLDSALNELQKFAPDAQSLNSKLSVASSLLNDLETNIESGKVSV